MLTYYCNSLKSIAANKSKVSHIHTENSLLKVLFKRVVYSKKKKIHLSIVSLYEAQFTQKSLLKPSSFLMVCEAMLWICIRTSFTLTCNSHLHGFLLKQLDFTWEYSPNSDKWGLNLNQHVKCLTAWKCCKICMGKLFTLKWNSRLHWFLVKWTAVNVIAQTNHFNTLNQLNQSPRKIIQLKTPQASSQWWLKCYKWHKTQSKHV